MGFWNLIKDIAKKAVIPDSIPHPSTTFPHGPSNVGMAVDMVSELFADTETEGKKAGYIRASKEYKPIYQAMKRRYATAIKEIQQKKENLDSESQKKISYLKRLEKERQKLEIQLNSQASHTAIQYNVSTASIKTWAAMGPSTWQSMDAFNLWERFKKWRRSSYEKEGYEEAQSIYEQKMEMIRQSFEQQKTYLDSQLKEYAKLLSDALKEISETKIQIANLKLLGRDE
jgi:hypothetical protein